MKRERTAKPAAALRGSDPRARTSASAALAFAYLAVVPLEGQALVLPGLFLVLLGLFLAGTAWSLLMEARRPALLLPSAARIVLALAGAAAFGLALLSDPPAFRERFPEAIAHFLFWNGFILLLSRSRSDFDVWTVGIIAISLFMVSAAFVQPRSFIPLLVLSLGCLLYASQRAALARCGPAGFAVRHGPWLSLAQLHLVMAVAAAVFLLFPRFSLRPLAGVRALPDVPTIGRPVATGDPPVVRSGVPRTGASLAPESLAPLLRDYRPVLRMRVTPERPWSRFRPGQPVYLRTAAYERYDRGQWSSANVPAERRAEDGWVRLDPEISNPDPVRQRILLMPLGHGSLPCMPEPAGIRVPAVLVDAPGTVRLPEAPLSVIEYEAVSHFIPETAEEQVQKVAPPRVADCLQLPRGLDRLRTEALSRTAGKPAAERAAALRDWLLRSGEFTYRLDPTPVPGMDPAEGFLFGPERAGYCLQFASALALSCRAAGVPARVAVGFHATEYDPGRDQYLVRLSDAHAWVEVPFPGYGWIPYDATPPDPEAAARPPLDDPALGADIADPPDTPGARWDAFLLNYDGASQSSLVREIAAEARRLAAPEVLGTLAGILVVAALVYVALPAAARRRVRRLLGRAKERSSVPFYGDFLWIAARKGLRKLPGLTPAEFAAAIGDRLPKNAVETVTRSFYDVRFGGRALGSEDERRVREALRRVETWSVERNPRPPNPL